MSAEPQVDDRAVQAAVNEVIGRVVDFDDDTRRRILRTVETFFFESHGASGFRPVGQSPIQGPPAQSVRTTSFADSAQLSPRDFLYRKQPQTDVDRVACLAYYLMHYGETPHFKTVDISLLNTEAAQVKFSNAAYAVVNATNSGLLVPAGKGAKQLSPQGERYVEALPDRTAAKEILANIRTRRARKAGKSNKQSEK